MLRNGLCAFALLALSLGLAMADTVKGKITKIEDGKITVEGIGAKKGEKGETKTFDFDKKDVKISRKDKKDTVPLENGLNNEALKDLGKGVGATLEVTGNKVREIIVNVKKK